VAELRGLSRTWRSGADVDVRPTSDRALVIGFGNPLREDDGIGWQAAELLQGKVPEGLAEIVCCHQLTPELAMQLETASLTIFLDASLEQAAGEVVCRPIHPEDGGASSHHLSPGQLLQFTRHLTGITPSAFLITGGAFRMNLGHRLTEIGEKTAQRMAEVAATAISLTT